MDEMIAKGWLPIVFLSRLERNGDMARKFLFVQASILGFCSALIASELVAFAMAGSRDQSAFLFFTMPFAVVVAGMCCSLNRSLLQYGRFIQITVSLLLGGVASVVWAIGTSFILGPWVGAFSMPIALCWIAGGVAAGVTTSIVSETTASRAVVFSILAPICCSGIAICIPPLIEITGQHRTVTTVFAKHHDNERELKITDTFGMATFTQQDVDAITKHCMTGEIEVVATSTLGRGTAVRLVFIMQRPVGQPQQFRVPKHGSVVLIQTESGWQQVPQDYESLNRTIELRDDRSESNGRQRLFTSYEIQHADGSRSGGSAIEWPQ